MKVLRRGFVGFAKYALALGYWSSFVGRIIKSPWFISLFALMVLTVAGGVAWWYVRLIPVSPSQYHVRGHFGPVVKWPLIPLQVLTLPDGRLMSYGSDGTGKQSALEIFDIWDPSKGTGPESHLILPNTTGTDLFCSGQIIVPAMKSVLVVGGDRTVDGVRNWSSPDINFLDYKTNKIKATGQVMARPRWYPTVMTLGSGQILVLGGRLDPAHYAPIPEIYDPGKGWATLTGADNDEVFGSKNWNYPRAWQTGRGDVTVVSITGEMFSLGLSGAGSLKKVGPTLYRGHEYIPSLMYAPGKILSMRLRGITYKIDIDAPEPVAKRLTWFGMGRYNASGTVMADGKVFVSGGGLKHNGSQDHLLANRLSMIWDPVSEKLVSAAPAQVDRLYHSTTLLMADGTVFTGGGGAGYVKAANNLNAEIYYPPYLFNQSGDGKLAPRPTIASAPDFLEWGQTFTVQVSEDISRLTLVKLGSATHAQVFDQRFLELDFTRENGSYRASAPATRNMAPPGYYFLFAFNKKGVPSIAKIVKLGA